MSLPEIARREKWIRARVALLEREKALTRARDELATERRRLPMVEVAKDYRFTAADGSSRTLLAVHDLHYNYRSAAESKAKYGLAELPSELHGTSMFLRVEDRVVHTYPTYGRVTEQVAARTTTST